MSSKKRELKLHPAAAVFRNEILGEVGKENKRLVEKISNLQPLLELIRKVEVIAAVSDDKITATIEDRNGVSVHLIPYTEHRSISTLDMSQGSIVDEILTISVESAPQLFLQNIGLNGGIGLRMAEKSLGFFPRSHFGFRGGTIVSVAEDNTASLTVVISPGVSIRGELSNLSNDDLIKFKEKWYDANRLDAYLMIPPLPGRFIESPEAVFTPTSVVMDLTPALKETMHLIERATASSELDELLVELEPLSPSQELRALTIEALGDVDHIELLRQNMMFERQGEALIDIGQLIMRVDLKYGAEALAFSLKDGELMDDEEGRSVWSIDLDGKEKSMAMNDVLLSGLFISGIRLNNGRFRQNLLLTTYEGEIGIRIQYTHSAELIGILNLNDLTEDEHAGIGRNLRMLLSGFGGIFPSTFKLNLKRLQFGSSSVGRILRMAGLCSELDSNADSESDE